MATNSRGGYRNAHHLRGFATPFGTIRLRIARARGKSFLPAGIGRFQRRALFTAGANVTHFKSMTERTVFPVGRIFVSSCKKF